MLKVRPSTQINKIINRIHTCQFIISYFLSDKFNLVLIVAKHINRLLFSEVQPFELDPFVTNLHHQ